MISLTDRPLILLMSPHSINLNSAWLHKSSDSNLNLNIFVQVHTCKQSYGHSKSTIFMQGIKAISSIFLDVL